MKSYDDISVVIPAYNAQRTIKRAIHSVLQIGSALLEVIVVDDGSLDHTSDIVMECMKVDSRVRLIKQDNMGRSAARNMGVKSARASWIMFVDADDYIFPGNYGELVNAAVNNCVDLLICMHSRPGLVGENDLSISDALDNLAVLPCYELKRFMIDGSPRAREGQGVFYEYNAAWSRLYRRDLIVSLSSRFGPDLAPFPVGLRFSEDRIFNLEYLCVMGDKLVGFVPFCSYYWDLGFSETCGLVRSEDIISLKRYIDVVSALKELHVVSPLDETLLLSREFIEQFKRAVKASCDQIEIVDSWVDAFTPYWCRKNLKHIPSDCLGLRNEWLLAAYLIKKGLLRPAFLLYRLMLLIQMRITHFLEF